MNLIKVGYKSISIKVFSLILSFVVLNATKSDAATIYFNDVFKGTGTSYVEQSSSITNIQAVNGSGFKFVSLDPADVTFRLTGNNVAGILSFVNSSGIKQEITGQISRQDKTGSTTKALYFFTNTGECYLLIMPGVTGYSNGNNVNTDSSPFLADMNAALTTQNSSPKILITDISVQSTVGYAEFTVSLSSAANANISFTPSLVAVTATLNLDYTSSMQYYNGTSWINITSTVTISQGSTSLKIRVPILDASSNVSRKFNLNTGTITGGNILNNDGTYGICTINYTPTITTSGTLSAFTTCSGVASSTQTVTVSGANLTNNITLTAPTGYELSTDASSFSNNVTLTQSSATVSSRTIYVRLTSAATNGASGTISVTSTGATSQTFSISAATVIALPTITLGTTSSVSSSATSFRLPYTGTTGSPNKYSITNTTPVLVGFNSITDASLSGTSSETIAIPASLANTYGFNITVKNTTTGCVSNPVAFTQTITGPLITINGSLSTFTTCSGVASATQTVTVEGTDLGSNIVLTAPTGYELSTDASSYSNSVTLTQSGGTVSSTSIYVRLTSAAINGATGTISVTSTNATTKTFATGTAVVNAIPSITLGSTSNVSTSATSFNLPYTATTGSPNQYSITTGATALTGFSAITNGSLTTSPINVIIPASAANTYNFNLTVKNSATGCESAPVAFTQTITQPTITTSGTLSAFTSCSGVASSTQTVTVSGVNLTNNITLTAPTDYELSTNASSYSNTVTLTQSGGTITTTTIYVRLTSAATNGASGTVSATSTGATSQTFSISAATVNALPTITLGATSSVSSFATSFNLPYTGTTGSPDKYSITNTTPVLAGFNSVTDASLSGTSSETITIPTSLANTYGFNITVKNSTTGCVSNPVAFTQTVTGPLITINGSLSTFTTCSGVASATQTITVEGANLGANVILSAPTGYELSSDASSYSNTVTLTQSGGTITTTTIYVRLNGSATNGASGTISATSTNAYTQTIATGTAVVNAIPTITLGTTSSISTSATSFNLPYSTTTGSPNQYSITSALPNQLAGFTAVSNATLSGTISVAIPASAANTYNFNLTVKNSATGCESAPVAFTQTITQPTINISGTLTAFSTCSGVASSTQTFTVSGANLINNITLTAPIGYELSSNSTSYSNTVTLTGSGGTLSSTIIYVKLVDNATSASSGTISITSSSAVSKTITVTTNTDNSLHFDGSNDKVTVNAGTRLDFGTGDFTIEMWAKPNDFSRRMDYFNKKSAAGTKDLGLIVETNAKVMFYTSDVPGTETIFTSNSTLQAAKWNHIALVRSGTNHYIYINGVLDAQVNSAARNITSTGLLHIGDNDNQLYFNGNLDELRFWNTARSATNIYDNLFTELSGSESGLVAYYKFNQGIANGNNTSIASLEDAGPYALNGTFGGLNLNGNTSNFVAGFIPEITAAGGASSLNIGNSLQLSNSLSGGVWSSANSNIASVNSSTGFVTGVAAGTVSVSYTICSKTSIYNLTVNAPTPVITKSGTLSSFTSCYGTASAAQTISVSAVNLTSVLNVVAPTGYEISTDASSYTSTLILTPVSGTVTTTTIYVRLTSAATNGLSGVISATSTGATSQSFSTGAAVVDVPPSLPTITGNQDVCVGLNTQFSANALSGALAFDGTGDVVNSATGVAALNITGDITVESWVKLNQLPSDWVRLIGKGDATNRTYGLWIATNGSLLWQMYGASGSIDLSSSSNRLQVGTWYHVAASRNANTVKIYINGVEVASGTYSATPRSSTQPLQLGGATLMHTLLNGSMDEVRVWNVSRSSAQILSNKDVEIVPQTGLVAYYNFNQGVPGANNASITTLNDLSGNGYNGSLSNFTLNGTNSNWSSRESISTGGVWTSSDQNVATVNTTGLVSAVSSGTSTITYTLSGTGSCAAITTVGTRIVTVNEIPTITLGSTINVSTSATSFNLPYTATTGIPDHYSITTGPSALTGFTPVSNATLTTSPIIVTIPASAANTYDFNLTVKNSTTGCVSAPVAFTQTIINQASTVVVTGATTYTYNASAQGPATNTKTGSTGAVTYSYVGTGSTTYGPSATPPTGVGTYQVIATLAADANYSGATSAPYAFTITAAGSTVVVTGPTTYTFNGSAQGPATNTKTGSTGAVTYSYVGTGSTTYGPSATPPTGVGTYQVIATLAADANYSGATSAPYAFAITAASSTVVVTGATTYTYNATAQGPATNTKTGSTGAVTYSYAGTGSTTYGPSATPPTGVGTYQVIATLAADVNYSGATSAPYAFAITAASSTVVVTGATTYTYNASAQGPATNTKTGSTGAVTYSYVGTGSTTYGPSATPPTGVGTY
ncbi:MAG: hypothetical protein RJA53_1462, partial [Bacteroidota bacterium]